MRGDYQLKTETPTAAPDRSLHTGSLGIKSMYVSLSVSLIPPVGLLKFYFSLH
jgi:hypothetical protein